MNLLWATGLLRRRPGRLSLAAAGVALAVALLALLGSFLAGSYRTMTIRASRDVAVDWQVQVQPGEDAGAVERAVTAAPGSLRVRQVEFARVPGFAARTGGTTQTTGAGLVLGIPQDYTTTFPGSVRTLAGNLNGAIIAQQTAANLHVAPGDTVRITLPGSGTVTVPITGVVDLVQADSLFQRVGAPPNAQPQAPPDNVVLLPQQQFTSALTPLTRSHPDLVTTQFHVTRDHNLAPDPTVAFTQDSAAALHLEATTAGAARVGDNLGAALDAARKDALYSRVLFLFLGAPGAILAGLLTAAIAASGGTRRRREQAILRARGIPRRRILGLAVVEAVIVGLTGSALGLAAAALFARISFGQAGFGATTASSIGWAIAAVVLGMGIAVATVVLPAAHDLRQVSVTAARASVGRATRPWWLRYGLDLLLLAGAWAVYHVTSQSGYQLVLVPEGLPTITVDYWAFLGPALLWLGAGLFVWRVTELLLSRAPVVASSLRPVAGNLAGTVAASLSRQRTLVARSVVLLALALSFAASTATFNSTYAQQAEADAQLTNGADVTVTEPPAAQTGPDGAARISSAPGVLHVEPIQHRFAYVGADLQDLYGVRPQSIRRVSALQDGYFQGGSATKLMDTLTAHPDSVLVSAETVKDFQLQPGDRLNLRLVDGRTHQLRTVPFRYAGVVKEFPTAPKDSFFVANASYVAARTGSNAVGSFLVDTGGTHQHEIAQRIRNQVGNGPTITDITTSRTQVGSSLTSVDLAGLTRVELGLAAVLAAAAGGLVLALGLNERRRTFAIATVLGASRRQVNGFVAGEALVVLTLGLLGAIAAGWALANMLVTVLTGVFDPPPNHLSLPWAYLATVAVLAVVAIAAATALAARDSVSRALSRLRDL